MQNINLPRLWFRSAIIAGLTLLLAVPSLEAQFGRRGGGDRERNGDSGGERGTRGGFGGPGGFGGGFGGGFDPMRMMGAQGGLVGALRWEGLGDELNLTDEQKDELQEIMQRAMPGPEAMAGIAAQFQGLSIEEMGTQVRKMAEERLAKVEEELQELLDDKQYARLKQVSLQQTGLRGLVSPENAEALELTEAQQTQLQTLVDEMSAQRRDLFRMSDEDREKRRQENDAKLLAVLTDEQKGAWNELLGPPVEGLTPGSGRPGGPAAPAASAATPAGNASETAETKPEGTEPPAMAESADIDPLDALLDAVDNLGITPPQPVGPAVVDFGVDLLAESTVGPEGGQSVSFNFQNAPWNDVLKLFARIAGHTLDMQSTPPGTFTYFDKQTYTPTEALDILNGYLLQRGYLLVRRDQFLIVANISQGIAPNLVPTVEVDELTQRGRNELVRTVFVVEQMRAAEVVEDVRSLLGPQGSVTAMGTTNRLVVTGLAQNLLRVQRLLEGSSPTAGPTDYAFRAFRLEHIPASDAEPTIRALLGVSSPIGSSSSSSSRSSRSSDPRAAIMEMMAQRMGGGDSRGGSSRGGSRGERGDSGGGDSSGAGEARITVDERSNSLLVAARPAEIQLVEQAIKQIDLPARDGSNAFQANTGPVLKVYPVSSGDLGKVAETLAAMVPGVVINQDGRANVLHVIATETRQREVDTLIRLLDGRSGGQEMAVVPLLNLDPDWARSTLVSMFEKEGAKAPVIQTDPFGEHLVVRGNSDDLLQVKSLIVQMSQTMGGDRLIPGLNSGPVRQIPLQGQDPTQLLRTLERMWDNGGRAPLRIIRPGESTSQIAPPRGDRPAPRQSQRPTEDDSVNNEPAPRSSKNSPLGLTLRTIPVVWQSGSADDEAEETDEQPSEPNREQATERGGISITVLGDQLVISGRDEDELNALQVMLRTLMQQMGARTQWSVFYLRVAEASTTAEMLRQLFSDVELVASTTATTSRGSRSAFPAPVETVSENPIRIVPETRSNALFISGPADRVREIEQVIQLLDSNELPENYRDRLARTIPVEYANVEEVAKILSEVYADLLPQRAPVRGRGGEEESSILQAGQLTLSVDSQNSKIVVSCNETLFRQVEDLVFSLDESAREARRTVRVVNLEYTDAATVQSTLGTLLPKVTFSTSGSRVSSSRSTGSPSAPTASPTPPSSGGSSRGESSSSGDDSRRRFFEDMMRRRSEGGGGESPFGRGGFGGRGGDTGSRGRGGR